jgi:hypothetical protein
MKYSLILFIAFAFFSLISCSQAKQDSTTQQVPALPQNEVQSSPVNLPQSVKDITAELSSTEQNNQGAMLNPPHGQPYHRCDIPVGAPLNSPPVNRTLETSTNQPVTAPGIPNNSAGPTIENAGKMSSPQTRSTTSPTTGSKPRLNPPHGQAWHRCDIAVGGPLP